MLLLIALSSALTMGLVVVLVTSMIPARPRGLKGRLAELELDGLFSQDAVQKRSRARSQIRQLIEYLGEQMQVRRSDWTIVRQRLVYAGYRDARAVPVFLGIRVGATAVLGTYAFLFTQAVGTTGVVALIWTALAAVSGWVVPDFILSTRITRRQKELRRALPDAMDLLVICVEAGLGLNQALLRVAREIRHQSRLMTEELAQTNAAIRAGTPRAEALAAWADRTGVDDIRSLATMLVQTERFGTSVAHSLRVHAESMRQKRRQRAEEAAAKTTIKMIFPLAFCIFPALFVVILGPAMISMAISFAQM
jgi:tight adherence protein C